MDTNIVNIRSVSVDVCMYQAAPKQNLKPNL